jgi:hypothetical protein
MKHTEHEAFNCLGHKNDCPYGRNELLEACKRALLDYEKLGRQISPLYGYLKQAIQKAEGVK